MSIPARITPALALVALAAACGTSERDDLVTEADRLCADAARGVVEAREDIGAAPRAQEAEELQVEIVDARAELAEGLADVEAPAGSREQFERFVEARERLVRTARDELRAIRARDRRAFEAAGMADREATERADRIGAGLGFEECSRRLSADAREEVRETIEQSVSGTPEEMCEALTESYVTEEFGDEESCVEDQIQLAPPESFELEELAGVADVSAEAVVRLVGGRLRGRAFRLDLVFVDGAYRIDRIAPLRPTEGPSGPR